MVVPNHIAEVGTFLVKIWQICDFSLKVIQNCVTGCIFQLNYKIQIKKNRNLIKNKKFLLHYYESIACFSKIFMQASSTKLCNYL